MTYYKQIKNMVLPGLEFYKDDLLKLDRFNLLNYKGQLLHASRNSGTDLVLFDNIKTLKDFDWAYTFAMRAGNNKFLMPFKGVIKEVTREKAASVMRSLGAKLSAELATIKCNNNLSAFNRENDKNMTFIRGVTE